MSKQSPSQHRSEQLSAFGDKEMPLSEDRGSNKIGNGQAMAASELSETRRSNRNDENVSITHMPRGSMTI